VSVDVWFPAAAAPVAPPDGVAGSLAAGPVGASQGGHWAASGVAGSAGAGVSPAAGWSPAAPGSGGQDGAPVGVPPGGVLPVVGSGLAGVGSDPGVPV
jgi:hypothetical protein